ncbi:hypothetical protein ACFUCV_00390 [Specibacter sp. NPDC057265]|uniref:hypothetical protein n=1 Tax=Specibacter sp. NPDC057265 TaxID=3346075 RepID=UPI0036445EF3
MKSTTSPAPKRSLAALGAGAALTLALTGCLPSPGAGNDGDSSPAAQEQSAAAATPESTSASSDRGGEDSPTTAAATKAATNAPAAAGKITEPGTELKFGEVAYTHSNSGEQGTEKYKEATHETKVTKIVKGSEADLAALKDASKFAGQIPYYVFTDVTLTSLSKPSAGIGDPRIQGHLKDGTEAQKLIVMGTMGECDSGNFKTEGDGDAFSYVVGSSKTICSVFLAPAGDEVTTASYDDSNFNYENYKDNKYRDNPITWG